MNSQEKKWTDQQLIEAIPGSNSIIDIIRKLNISTSSKNYRRIREVAISYDIELPGKQYKVYQKRSEVTAKKVANEKYKGDCNTCNIKIKKNRMYCKDCFLIYKYKNKNKQITCNECNKEYIYDWKKGHTLQQCNSCSVNKPRLQKFKLDCVNYLGGSCEICGYNKCLRSLHFHHKNPKEKSFGISGSHGLAWEKVLLELDKCVLLCSNCHSEVHDGITELP